MPNKDNHIIIIRQSGKEIDPLIEILNMAGFQVTCGGYDDLNVGLIEQHSPLLLLLEIVEADIKEQAKLMDPELFGNLPVIVLSRSDKVAHKVLALDSGAVDYITMPFVFEEVISRVQTHIQVHYQRLELERLREAEKRYYTQLNQFRDDLLQSTTHDLKNPLTVIKTYAHLLSVQAGVQANEKSVEFVEQITRSADRMQQLIEELLEIARLETGLAIETRLHQLAPFLREQIETYQALANKKEIELVLDVRDELLFAEIDELKFGRVIDNLLSNALKYTPKGGKVQVWLVRDTNPDYAQIAIRDDGLGIPNDAKDHVFDKFYRVTNEEHMKQDGSGLGLAMAKLIVERHGGEIRLDSMLGEGTTFFVTVPLYA